MADVELVIKIPEEEYKCVQITGCIGNKTCISNAIYNGVPLPKGHGDLVDRNDLLAESYVIDDYAGNEINIVDRMTVEMVDAIIEADKEQE